MEALHLIHKLVPGRQRRYRLSSHGLNRSVDSILDGLDGSKRRASYPANSEVNMLFSFSAKESLILQFKYMIVICRILRWKLNLNAMAFTMVCLVKTKPHEKLWKSDFRRGAFNLVSYLSCCHSVIISVSKILKYDMHFLSMISIALNWFCVCRLVNLNGLWLVLSNAIKKTRFPVKSQDFYHLYSGVQADIRTLVMNRLLNFLLRIYAL